MKLSMNPNKQEDDNEMKEELRMENENSSKRVSFLLSDPDDEKKKQKWTNTCLNDLKRRKKLWRWRFLTSIIVFFFIVLIIVFAAVFMNVPMNDPISNPSEKPTTTKSIIKPTMESMIDVNKIMNHLNAFQLIANQSSGSRSPKYGYNASLLYVENVLKMNASILSLTKQSFAIPYFDHLIPSNLNQTNPFQINYQNKIDFYDMGGFVGRSTISALLIPIDNYGCNLVDFLKLRSASFALIKRGICPFSVKIQNAIKSGARGCFIYNDGTSSDRMLPFLGNLGESISIPVFSLSFILGSGFSSLYPNQVTTMSIQVNSIQYTIWTQNLCAQIINDTRSTILIGSHLDSVDAGPGINDNGSGSATNLELALIYASSPYFKNLKNSIRFCWWGGEELGLLGSTFYVSQLTPEQKQNIKAVINLDMIASPNKFNGIYNGSMADDPIKNISTQITNLFIHYFNENSIPFDLTPFDGRSDYGPFIDNNTYIPAGGIFTGAEQLKSEIFREKYGGLTNAPFDPCYHQSCDTIQNIDISTLQNMSKATAYVVSQLIQFSF